MRAPRSPRHRHSYISHALPLRCAMMSTYLPEDTATERPDHIIAELVEKSGHLVLQHLLLPPEPLETIAQLELLLDGEADVVILAGAMELRQESGIADAVRAALRSRVLDFSEPFRFLSYQAQPSSVALLSQAWCGTAKGKLILWLCGPYQAVRVALSRVLLPKLRELVWELCRRTPVGGLRLLPASHIENHRT